MYVCCCKSEFGFQMNTPEPARFVGTSGAERFVFVRQPRKSVWAKRGLCVVCVRQVLECDSGACWAVCMRACV